MDSDPDCWTSNKLRQYYKQNWSGSQRAFVDGAGINQGNFSNWLNHSNVSSPASERAVRDWIRSNQHRSSPYKAPTKSSPVKNYYDDAPVLKPVPFPLTPVKQEPYQQAWAFQQASPPPSSYSPFGSPSKPKRSRIPQEIRDYVFSMTKGHCYLCQTKLPERGWHIEHIIPFSKDPARDRFGNFLPSCARCNLRKGAKNLTTFARENSDIHIITGILDLRPGSLDATVVEQIRKAKYGVTEHTFVEVGDQNYHYFRTNYNLDEEYDDVHIQELTALMPKMVVSDVPDLIVNIKLPEVSGTIVKLDPKQFIFGQTLNRGGFGDVIKASWNNTQVAIKKANRPGSCPFIINEVNLLSQIGPHPNIVICHGYLEQDDLMCAVLELFPMDLAHKIKKKSWSMMILYLTQTVIALNFLHSKKIIHRDMKPQNILVDDDKQVAKLCDFGHTKQIINPDENTRVGTAFYIAPEVRGGRYYPATDFFSVGRIIEDILNQITFQTPLLAELADNLHARDPMKRPSGEMILQHLNKTKGKLC